MKTKALINFAVTAKLICVFVFAYMQIVGFLMRWLISYVMTQMSFICLFCGFTSQSTFFSHISPKPPFTVNPYYHQENKSV